MSPVRDTTCHAANLECLLHSTDSRYCVVLYSGTKGDKAASFSLSRTSRPKICNQDADHNLSSSPVSSVHTCLNNVNYE